MESIGSEEVGNALLIMSGLLVMSMTIVGLAMWGVYKFFKHKETQPESKSPQSSEQKPAED